jgi:hypothetical protein
MQIDKPIFIIGSGRSGTTILYKLLSVHPDLCWFSTYSNLIPKHPNISVLHRIFDIPVIGKQMKKSITNNKKISIPIPKPAEGDNIYHSYCGFIHSYKTTEHDFNQKNEEKFKKIIIKHLKATGKSRFLSKQTANNQRIRLINKMFPNAFYIHIIRDGRAVANSLFHVKWWNDTDIWWLGKKPSEMSNNGRNPIELCGLHWKKDTEEILKNKYLFEDRYLEIKYENLVKNTKKIIHQITDFCKLSWPYEFEETIPSELPNMDYKWQKKLNDNQKEVLYKILKDSLKKYGYKLSAINQFTSNKS